MRMPAIGDRVHVTPTKGLNVQRGENLFGQFLPPEGMEVVWSEFHIARMNAGELFLMRIPAPDAAPADAPATEPAPVAPEAPSEADEAPQSKAVH